jgi:GNAT superfamily N-acetyltransferase
VFTIKETSAQSLIALRWQVLRPGRPESTAHFVGDDAPGSVHVAAFDADGEVIGCASVLESAGRLQLRGMATVPEWQGKGVGRAMLKAVCELARQRQLSLWCNARVSAMGFYQKCGWEAEGEIFEVPEFGLHTVMRFSSESC